MRVLITGVAGLIGSHIAERAVAAGQIVRGVDVPGADTSRLHSLGIELVEGDLVDPQVARRAVQGCEVVYNAVGRTGDYGTSDLYHRPNVLTTESVLAAAIGAGVRRIVHASSYMVSIGGSFHHWRGGIIDDQTPEPSLYGWDFYGRSKVAAERAVLQQQHQLEVVPLRLGWVYGPRDRMTLPGLVKMLHSSQGLIFGDGRNRLALTYAADIADAFVRAADPSVPAGRPLVVAGAANGQPVTQADYLYAIADQVGAPRPTKQLPVAVAMTLGTILEATWHVLRIQQRPLITSFAAHLLGRDQVLDASSGERALGWAPRTTFADGIRQTLAWLEQERALSGVLEGAPA